MLGVFILAWLVNSLLLGAVNRFLGSAAKPVAVFLGALLGAAGIGASLLPGVSFLDSHGSRALLLGAVCVVVFGIQRKLPLQLGLFALLHFSVGGLSGQTAEPVRMALGALGIGLACRLMDRGKRLIPVELACGNTRLKLTALYDTGNTLRDPVTGQEVLVLDSPSAQALTGLSQHQLENPVEAMGSIPGLRLIPYHTVGNSGFLLAMGLPVRMGNRQESTVVAFAPQSFGSNYQALTGGKV